MSNELSLDVSPRTVIGKQVKQLREKGIIPGVIYGPKHEKAIPVQMNWVDLRPVLVKAGATHLIDLKLQDETISVLIREVQRHPVRGAVLNIDFYAADTNAPLKTVIPIIIPDVEAQAKRLGGRILQTLSSVEVESLPKDIPQHISVDMSSFSNVRYIRIKDLPPIEGVRILADEDTLVARIFVGAMEEEYVEEEYSSEIGEVEVIGRGVREEAEEEE